MPKEIDIRKTKATQKEERVFLLAGPKGSAPVKKPQPVYDTGSPVTQSFISRFLDIMVCDIMQKLRFPLSPRLENLKEKEADFNKFEQFCELARGKR
jgi:hypothetical protein